MRFPDLETRRLHLIETRAEHADALYSIYSDPAVTFLYPKEPCESLEECRRVLASMASVNHRRGWRWTLVRRDGRGGTDDEIAGTGGFHAWDRQRREAKHSYELVPAARGRGLASEAVREALRYGFAEMGLDRVLAEIHPDNTPSRRLAGRLGFRQVSHSSRYWRGDSVTYLVFERLAG